MTATPLLVDLLLKSTLVVCLASLTVSVMRKGSAASRHFVWAVMFVAIAVLPAMILMLPKQTIVRATPAVHSSRPLPVRPQPSVSLPSSSEPELTTPSTSPTPEPTRSLDWPGLLFAVWALGTSCSLLATASRLARARHLARSAKPTDDPKLRLALDEAGARLWPEGASLRRPIELRLSGDVQVPMTLGLLRPVILLPESCRSWAKTTADAVLRHECAHIRRHDWAVLVGARVVQGFYWFHPLVRFAEGRMKSESENAADDLVLLAGTDASTYARELIELASGMSHHPNRTWALAIVERGKLTTRVKAILGSERRRGPLRTRYALATSTACLAAVSVFACTRFVQGPASVVDGRYFADDRHVVEIVAITDLSTGPARSWNAHGEILREPLPVTDFVRRALSPVEADGSRRRETPTTRYVLVRTNGDDPDGIVTDLSLSDNGASAMSWGYEYPAEPWGRSLEFNTVFGGSIRLIRCDFTPGPAGELHAWVPAGSVERLGSATFRNGVLKTTTNPDLRLAIGPSTAHDGLLALRVDLPRRLAESQAMALVTIGGRKERFSLKRYATGEQTIQLTGRLGDITKMEVTAQRAKHVVLRGIPLAPKPLSRVSDHVSDLPNLRKAKGNTCTMPDGTKIELALIADHRYYEGPSWSMDGSPARNDRELGWRFNMSWPLSQSEDRILALVFRLSKGVTPTSEVYDRGGIGYRVCQSTSLTKPGGKDILIEDIQQDKDAREGSVVLKFAFGKYEPVASGVLGSARFPRRYVTDQEDGLLNSLRVRLPKAVTSSLDGRECHIELRDAKGRAIDWSEMSGPSETGEVAFLMPKKLASQAVSISIACRPYGYAEFDDVQFYPRR